MSTDQDKESFALKRNRGGDAGLDGLVGPGLLLGNPDKKKRKSNSQASSLALLSEYAPPPNPSSDHLVASNPFDDNYNSPPSSLKPLGSTSLYFGSSQYSGFGSYAPLRMAPHLQNRMPSPYVGPYQIRNQPHLFGQNPMGFNRGLPGFGYGRPEHPAFPNQTIFNNSNSNVQLFRPGAGDNLTHLALPSMNQNPNPNLNPIRPERPGSGFAQEGVIGPNIPTVSKLGMLDVSPGVSQPTGGFTPPSALTPKQEPGDAAAVANKNYTQSTVMASPRKQTPNSEDGGGTLDGQTDLKGKNRGSIGGSFEGGGAEKINGILNSGAADPLKKSSPQPGAVIESQTERNRRLGAGNRGCGGKAANRPRRTGNTTSSSSSSSTEPLYPCGICLSEVKDDQEAILCEASCQKWFHRLCTGMTETAYNLLTAEADAVWGCDGCMQDKTSQLVQTRETPCQPVTGAEGQT